MFFFSFQKDIFYLKVKKVVYLFYSFFTRAQIMNYCTEDNFQELPTIMQEPGLLLKNCQYPLEDNGKLYQRDEKPVDSHSIVNLN